MGVYAATKHAVRTISEALRQESGPHLRVTEISPGMISTDFASSITDPTVKETIVERFPTFNPTVFDRTRHRLRDRAAGRYVRRQHCYMTNSPRLNVWFRVVPRAWSIVAHGSIPTGTELVGCRVRYPRWSPCGNRRDVCGLE